MLRRRPVSSVSSVSSVSTARPVPPPPAEGSAPGAGTYRSIARDLADAGWSIEPDFLAAAAAQDLVHETRQRWQEGRFDRAGVGRSKSWGLHPEVRSDWVQWLDESDPTPAQARYRSQLELLRLAINERLFLGLFGFEGHLACYPPGALYRRHLDQHRNSRQRVVSVILYLNSDWTEADGGALRLYLGEGTDTYRDVYPAGGTLVCFLSDTFYHEVLPARRERLSLTGWFRRSDG